MESDKRKVWARVRNARALWFVVLLASRPAHKRSVPSVATKVKWRFLTARLHRTAARLGFWSLSEGCADSVGKLFVASPVRSYAAHEWLHQRSSKHFRLHWVSKAEWHPSVHRVHPGRQRQCGFLCERLFQGALAVS